MADAPPQPDDPSASNEQPKDVKQPAAESGDKAAEKLAASWDGERIFLKGEIEIFPDQRLPEYDQRTIKAYRARSKNDENCYALLCDRKLLPRVGAAAKYHSILNPNLARLVASGVVDWLPEKKQIYAFIYENHGGRKLTKLIENVSLGWKAETVISTIIKPLAYVLDDLRNVDLVHGSIRPDNIYIVGEGASAKAILGECLALPFSYATPAALEPVNRGVAQPIARGLGSFDDDLYHFGATIACILRSNDPMTGRMPAEITEYKVEHGSFQSFIGRERIVGNILELLRGLLQDDVRQRWNLEDLLAWLQGTRINPKQQAAGVRAKASRPLDFNHKKFMRPQLLALEIANHPLSVPALVTSGDLKQWLNRSLQDTPVEKQVDEVVLSLGESIGASNYAPKLALRLAVALSPELPIIYKGLKFYPDGFANAFVEAVAAGKDLTTYAEIMQEQAVLYWINHADVTKMDVNTLIHGFDNAKNFLKHQMIGYGLERCIYVLSADAPCLSDKLRDYYVRTPEDLFMALNHMAEHGDRPDMPYDRHIAAFLSVRDRKVIDNYLADIASGERHRYVIGVLKSLALIQTRAKLPEAPALSSWMVDFVKPAIGRFHDKELKTRLADKLERVRNKGDMSKVLAVFEESNIAQNDYRGFYIALRDYLRLKNEIFMLQGKLDHEKDFGMDAGRQYAAVISGAIAILLVLAYAALHFGNGFTIVG
ncbi:MAG: hypothetical protein GC136_04200 [Alphaproteobacteria bacterium]|nr:hypothetical protein [Alphaproteobacteria bacterium]